MRVTLHYYSINRSRSPEPRAVAECEARITKAQIVILSGTTTNENGIRLGGLPIRFNRKNGRAIPNWLHRHSWELAPGEIDRVDKSESDSLEAMERDLRAHGDPI